MYTINKLTSIDISLLMNVADDVFDNAVNEKLSAEFLNDPRHHIVVAIVDEQIVGLHLLFITSTRINQQNYGLMKLVWQENIRTRVLPRRF